ncbi:MAG: carbohydrate ABC transporter permease [Chloroflexota bacterium]|nr:carbohydrate ABC transporter permease [Chloroflexota bacterium]
MATIEQVRTREQASARGGALAPGQGWRIAGYAAMVLAVAIIGVPLLWMVSAAFKETREIYVIPATWIPREPTLANFPRAWQAAPFGLYYLNTTIVTVIGVLGKLILGSLAAYALAVLSFPFKNVIFALILGAIMVPPQVQIIPNYLLFADLNLVNTLAALSVPHIPTAIGTFLLRQAFLSVPREILDAARVDGAGHVRLLWTIMLPLSLPVVVTFTLLATQDVWNEFLWPIVITNTANMRTLPIGIFWLLDQEGNTQWGVVMAGAIYVIAPLIAVFLWAQRHIVEGIAAGAIKG